MKAIFNSKRFLSLFLAFVMILGMLPMTALAAENVGSGEPVSYNVWIGGEQFTSEKLIIQGDTGTATYDPDTKTLTLDNYTYTGEGLEASSWGSVLVYIADDLNIVLKGENKLISTCDCHSYCYGIYNGNGLTTIIGENAQEDTLHVESKGETDSIGSIGIITFSKGIHVEACTLTVKSETDGMYLSGNTSFKNSIINVSCANADNQYGIVALNNLSIDDSAVTVSNVSGIGVYSTINLIYPCGYEWKVSEDDAYSTEPFAYNRESYLEIKPAAFMATWTDGDGASYEKKFQYGEVITIPTSSFFEETFREPGYTLTGWQNYTEGMTMPFGSVTFTAVYVPNQYTVSFDANGGENIDPITVTFGEKYGTLPSSAITGLSGGNKNWYLVDADGNVTETNIKNLTLVSTARDHKLFIKRNVLAPSVSVALTVPGGISDGYQYYIPGASQRVLTATIGNMNTDILEYTYQWYKDGTPIEGDTSNVLNLDGNVSDDGIYKVEVTATLKDGTNIVVTANSATGSKEQKVKILRAANTLYYDANGGEGGPSSNYTGGTGITVQTNEPTREGYIFNGWNTKVDGTGESYKGGDSYTFADDNGNGGCTVTLYAQWLKVYDVYVGGTQITEANKGDVFGDGKVSYDAETNTLTLSGAEVLNGYEYMEDCIAGVYAEGDLNIELIGTENIVVAPDAKKSSYGIRVLGDLSVSGDGTITVDGGDVIAQDTNARSVGIFVDGALYISEANVNASGGNTIANGEGTAYSGGVYADGGLDVDLEGYLNAKGAKAEGFEAYSSGIEAIGSEDNYINISVYDGYLTAEGGEAVGVDYAGSTGVYISCGGLYLYDNKADAELSAGKAVVTSEDKEKAYAYSNGIFVFAGDVNIAAGKITISSGSHIGVNGDAYAVYVKAGESVDDNGNPYIAGGNFTVECDEVKPGLYSPSLFGTTVTINSPNGNAIRADGGIDISEKLFISLPENGDVSGVGGSEDPENWIEPDRWIILDSQGAEAQNVIIEPLTYKVYIKGLSYDMAVTVPAGESVNQTYCELFEMEDFSERLNTNKEGYTFAGWYTDEACTEGNEFGFDDTVDFDITIYAKWVSVATGDDTEVDGNQPPDNTQQDGGTGDDNNKPTTDSTQSGNGGDEDDDSSSNVTSPDTGDNSNMFLWVVLFFISGGAVITLAVVDRKKKTAKR